MVLNYSQFLCVAFSVVSCFFCCSTEQYRAHHG